ncbi:putative PMT4-dolichyl-phosphate-mannose--protein O-mannosyltransferase [Syncephalastrum racemosum]|uniref:Dolichyl-phosphate-mannose--protein mannosyltransferase n=1 Tax=Syncephalastrum racemosum TaxID=13706 RepID=A0A1X2HTV5_SYNRA|nr:putative PMT4-dolichyl-phosphate-mannose--protein O-mannosyltransferase [Syncephalastrum racemosum]
MGDPKLRRRHGESSHSNESSSAYADEKKKELGPASQPIPFSTKHRPAMLLVTALASITTFYKIWYPSEVVFDEVHFGKFAGFYLKRTYYFDVHPPLAKLMLAAAGYLLGYDGHYDFANIGEDYIKNNVPYVGLRILPATLNVFNVAIIYNIMKQSGYSVLTCALTAALYALDNSMVSQNRLIMLDSMLIFYMLLTVYSYIRFRQYRHQPFTASWWIWLTATGVAMASTVSVKLVGLFVVGSIGVCVLVDLWALLDIKRGLSMNQFMRHFNARALCLIVLPIGIYLFWFWVHFTILDQSGPGDTFMSAKFQETLKNSAIKLKSLDIHYYDTITLQHRDTDVFLHSHNLHYPLRYDDGRISSQGQQVTGVKEKDENCYWRVLPTKEVKEDEKVKVKHNDVIRLEHIGTNTVLLTHDVASPLLSTNEEITTTAPDTRYNETRFRVVLDDYNNGNTWATWMKGVKLMHVNTNVALWTRDVALPDWGMGQQDVNGNKNVKDKSNFWMATEIKGLNATEINLNKKKNIRKMWFISKFFELQSRMLSHNAGLTKPHPYQSTPITWPFLIRGISYWSKDATREQIYMTGNLFGWWLSVGGVAVYAGIMLADVLARRRGLEPIDEPIRNRFITSAGFFVILWLFHYLPFFAMGRALFLHHYLPAQTCNYLLLGAVFQFMFIDGVDSPVSRMEGAKPLHHKLIRMKSALTQVSWAAAAVILIGQFAMFVFLSPLTYGTPGMDVAQVIQHKLLNSWDLQFAK